MTPLSAGWSDSSGHGLQSSTVVSSAEPVAIALETAGWTMLPVMSKRRPREALAVLLAAAGTGELERFCIRWDVLLLVAFGSAADPERADAAHDLDLAVAFAKSPPGLGYFTFITELMGWLQLSEVDVLELDRADPVSREQALAFDIVPLYERRAGTLAERQMQATAERMDEAWLRRLDLALLAGS